MTTSTGLSPRSTTTACFSFSPGDEEITGDNENVAPAPNLAGFKLHTSAPANAATAVTVSKKALPPARPAPPNPASAKAKEHSRQLPAETNGESAASLNTPSRVPPQPSAGTAYAAAAASSPLISMSDSPYSNLCSVDVTTGAFVAPTPPAKTSDGMLNAVVTAPLAKPALSPASPAAANGSSLLKPAQGFGSGAATAAALTMVPKKVLAHDLAKLIFAVQNGDLTSKSVIEALKLIIGRSGNYPITERDKKASVLFLQELQKQKPATLQAAMLIFKSIFKNCGNPGDLCITWLAFHEEFEGKKARMLHLLATENPIRPFELPLIIRGNPKLMDREVIRVVANELLMDMNSLGEELSDDDVGDVVSDDDGDRAKDRKSNGERDVNRKVDRNHPFRKADTEPTPKTATTMQSIALFQEFGNPSHLQLHREELRDDLEVVNGVTQFETALVEEIVQGQLSDELADTVSALNAIEGARKKRQADKMALVAAVSDALLRDLLSGLSASKPAAPIAAAPPKQPAPKQATHHRSQSS